jgi:hypothetical protein
MIHRRKILAALAIMALPVVAHGQLMRPPPGGPPMPENRMLLRLGRMIAVATGLIIAATATATGVILHYLPHA